jgi:hypothetical protein
MPITLARSADFLAIARRHAASPDDWPFAPRYDPLRRWYGRLLAAEDHEVWVLTWLPGQATELHDHGGAAGAFVVVSGAVVEQVVSGGTLIDVTYEAGQGHNFGPHHVHRIGNAGSRPAVSVHAYGPALHTMTTYRLAEGRLSVDSVARAGADW